MNMALVPQYARRGYRLTCCYSSVTRFISPYHPDYYKIGSCKIFRVYVKLKPQEEFVLSQCYKKGYKIERVYVNMHGLVPIKPSVAKKRRERKSPDDDDKLNVLLVAYDSMSRLNLLRTMPKTVDYLKRAGYVDLQGYNKVGDNTFPNILALLTGVTKSEKGRCSTKGINFDDCPFLWKEFHNHNYVSAYAEDVPEYGTFQYLKGGFFKQPTDYYFRPYMLAASERLRAKFKDVWNVCSGPILTADHIFNYALRFVSIFKNYFYFALFILSSFSHNDLNGPRAMDQKTVEFFQRLDDSGAYNNTIVVFFSDHGMRFSKILETHVGWLENRLPFVYIHLPDSFKNKYPEAYRNLQMNRNRLTCTYDLYVTLKDVLARGMNSIAPGGNVSIACPKCKSLFSGDFGDRSCRDAGITPDWCTCSKN
ncbi:Uncharacterized protein GBIM_16586 [Gryllus bimaculatus]|nr:Uncharacterized protein GBIM_16586 [Gryllus bimaculatus]